MPVPLLARCGTVLLMGLLAAAAPPPDVETTVRNDVAVLGFVRRTPLTLDEQGFVSRFVADRYAADPKGEASGAGGAALAVQVIAGSDQRKRAIVREMYRLAFEEAAPDNPERRIVLDRDPTIAYDPESKMVVSERTLDDALAAATWAARVLHAPPPTPQLRTEAHDILASDFKTFDHANQEAYAHILRNMAVALPVLARESPEQQRAALLHWGKPEDGKHLLMMATATMEYTAFQASGAGGGGRPDPSLAILHSMTQRNMAQSTWQMRHPECGPMGGNPSSCSQAPILQPIAPPFP